MQTLTHFTLNQALNASRQPPTHHILNKLADVLIYTNLIEVTELRLVQMTLEQPG